MKREEASTTAKKRRERIKTVFTAIFQYHVVWRSRDYVHVNNVGHVIRVYPVTVYTVYCIDAIAVAS